MKKLIAILAVFAIMVPALFAQDAGTWTIGGEGEIGSNFNLRPWELRDEGEPNSEQSVVLVGGNPYNSWEAIRGVLNIGYKKGDLTTRIQFDQSTDIGLRAEFNNGIFAFHANSKLIGLLNGTNSVNVGLMTGDSDDTFSFLPGTWARLSNLWGWYKMLDGIIHVEAAIKSQRYDGLWEASAFVTGDTTYSLVDGDNMLMVNITPIQALQLGFILPGIFDVNLGGERSGRAGNGSYYHDGVYGNDEYVGPLQNASWMYRNNGRRFLEGSIEYMTFGIRYGAGPIRVAAQYALRGRDTVLTTADSIFIRSNIYAGAQYDITSAIMAELEFKGEFFKSFDEGVRARAAIDQAETRVAIPLDRAGADDLQENVSRMKLDFGAGFQYSADPLVARLRVIFRNDVSSRVEGGVVRFEPYFAYKIIPSHLSFALESGIDLPLSDWVLVNNVTAGGRTYTSYATYAPDLKREWLDADDDAKAGPGGMRSALGYSISPRIMFNMLGTGAPENGKVGTGLTVRYTLGGSMYSGNLFNKHSNDPTTHNLQLTFNWQF